MAMIPQRAWEGDEWKHQPYIDEDLEIKLSRAKAQEQADDMRIAGVLTQRQWWIISNALSDPQITNYENLFEEVIRETEGQ